MAVHPSIKRIAAAYKWSKQFKAKGGKLLITPTVGVELTNSPQVIDIDYSSYLYYAVCRQDFIQWGDWGSSSQTP